LVISTKLEKVGNRSSLLKQQIIRKGTEEVVAEALVTFVVTDRSGRAMTMDGKLREQIEQLA
jgi:acyl-CoA thioesterase FadM